MTQITAGAVVRLKSGGPTMTVALHASGNFICLWFDGSELKSGTFQQATLAIADENEASTDR